MPDGPTFPIPPQGQPTRDLLMAQALEACIRAERARTGSSEEVIAREPAATRDELRHLVELGRRLERAAPGAQPSATFRANTRARLMQRIDDDGRAPLTWTEPRVTRLGGTPGPWRSRAGGRWLVRTAAGLLAAALAVAATLTASASALPGDPLYGVKQGQEELDVRLAPDDEARAVALLRRADARLDETSRLLRLGRTEDALETSQRYGQVVEQATTAYAFTLESMASRLDPTLMQSKLAEQQQRLEALAADAPETARADLRTALVTTTRGRELVANPRPLERVLGQAPGQEPVAAAEPTSSPEPTAAPAGASNAGATTRPSAVAATPTPEVAGVRSEPPAPEVPALAPGAPGALDTQSAPPQPGLVSPDGQPGEAPLADAPTPAPAGAAAEDGPAARATTDGRPPRQGAPVERNVGPAPNSVPGEPAPNGAPQGHPAGGGTPAGDAAQATRTPTSTSQPAAGQSAGAATSRGGPTATSTELPSSLPGGPQRSASPTPTGTPPATPTPTPTATSATATPTVGRAAADARRILPPATTPTAEPSDRDRPDATPTEASADGSR